ncbi:MAG: hypothetical protein KGL39_44010, partial [Patescibacteria group bacterium]|nr:hypothetical protein [Patescibacteria group bacterium]
LANSPEQLYQVIKTYKNLMGGQLRGLKFQYEDATGFKTGPYAFDQGLAPETIKELDVQDQEGKGGEPKSESPPKEMDVPPAYKDKPDGTIMYNKDGFAYTKKGDKIELMQ